MRFQRLDDWLDWQSELHPSEIELGLERVAAVWRRLRPSGLNAKVITVAGTNGKGSTAAMLEGIYLEAGYRVVTYTSPHLVRYNERIRLNGIEVDDARLCEAFDRVDRARRGISLTYFEFGTLAALDIFAAVFPDLAILEVGLGGRLDAVNIVDPDVAIITTIDLDHTEWLGESRAQIGLEKAGIMRAEKPVILGEVDLPGTILTYAAELGADCLQLGRDFAINPLCTGYRWQGRRGEHISTTRPALPGEFQWRNLACARMAVECLADALPVTESAIDRGVASSRLKGRMQIFDGEIPLILDVAHNAQAVTALCENLRTMLPEHRLHAVFGLLSDKDLGAILQPISPMIESWYLVSIETARGQSAQQLAGRLRDTGIQGPIGCFDNVAAAVDAAKSAAVQGDAILVFGSFILVGAALVLLEKPDASSLI